ncbi:hypothetical protein QTP70_033187 [Hemibagrus guttatus]|uniref:Uncharacterized protein n=1 Tax=Hemibagrus guttatus TaxID=175788 RepID=A0AAE0PS15_9TELE|nr:hypothetical protein QTP70_033187 [Hemibagrus guttatus]
MEEHMVREESSLGNMDQFPWR